MHFGAKRAHALHLVVGDCIRHGEDGVVAQGIGNQGKADARVAPLLVQGRDPPRGW